MKSEYKTKLYMLFFSEINTGRKQHLTFAL